MEAHTHNFPSIGYDGAPIPYTLLHKAEEQEAEKKGDRKLAYLGMSPIGWRLWHPISCLGDVAYLGQIPDSAIFSHIFSLSDRTTFQRTIRGL